ncbi:ATP-binding protein [Sphingomonas sp.]|jgi:molecular chaperone HtpG|uniref:ATP-binding protein n=1 Tax=Sphingomonas sp. TaxID=28214 RepID=UPI002ED7DD05
MTAIRTIQVQPYFGGFILETLTVGMYGESRNAIREYIQNAFDSIRSATPDLLAEGEGLIEIEMHADRDGLTIRDNGGGISAGNSVGVLTAVGASGKSHRSDAGFRGIGRLAGIVFSSKVTFTTRAAGEDEKTVVVFDGDLMRELMSPGKGSSLPAEQVLIECVAATIGPIEAGDPPHFLEVRLEGFRDPPDECTEFNKLSAFVSQVGPVPYAPDFPFRAQLRQLEAQVGIAIDEVRVTIRHGARNPVPIYKLYGPRHEVAQAGMVNVDRFWTQFDEEGRWWLWVGQKDQPGSYLDPNVSGIRVRIKNIQIDGTEIFREVFQKHAKSFVRFPDWFVGEVFVAAGALVPNARRDTFEEDAAWKQVRRQLGVVASELGRDAYAISNAGQMTLEKLSDKAEEMEKAFGSAKSAGFRSQNRLIEISAEVTKLQKRVATASRDADPTTSASLQAVGSQLADVKVEAIRALGGAGPKLDTEAIELAAREELLREVWSNLERGLAPQCLAQARKVLTEEYGDDFS